MDPRATIRAHLRAETWERRRAAELGFEYRGPADFVLRHGRWWPVGPFRRDLPRGPERHCYGTSIGAVVLLGLRYVEGYAVHQAAPDDVIPHAWNADEDGRVVDLTWVPHGVAYLGVEFCIERADDASWYGDACVLDDFHRGWPLLRSRWSPRLERDPDPAWRVSPTVEAVRAHARGDIEERDRLLARADLEAFG